MKEPDIKGGDWYNHFFNLHTEHNRENVEIPSYNISCEGNISNEPFSKKEFTNVISNLKNNKAVGSDGILNEMVKNAPETILNLLRNFINLCLCKSLIPQSWCMDLITPIFKDGSINDPDNYRGMCISSVLLKIICTLLQNRIQGHCNKFNLINENQIGFKSNHRTSDHLLTLKTIVKKYVTIGKKKLYACFVDFKKAFDSVWHKGLFHKILKNGINGNILNFIKEIYKKTKCAVKSGNSRTDFFKFTKGVRQGCPISPILFNLYINDIFKMINSDNESDIFLEVGKKVNALMYADDLILLSDTKEGLQKQIDKMSDYCYKWKLTVDIKKTKTMIFNRGNRLIKSDFTYKNTVVENTKQFKYLGFTISAKNCSFGPTIDDLSLKANRAIFALNNKFKISKLPKRLALKLFYSLISPILLYGSEVWGAFMDYDYSSWESSKIERVQTQFIKRLIGCRIQTSNMMARGEVGRRPLLLDIVKRVIGYTNNIKKRTDSTVNTAFVFECNNETTPNFSNFLLKFDIDIPRIFEKNKSDVRQVCQDAYDRFWWEQINNSSKASTYVTFKTTIFYEKYFDLIESGGKKTSLTRFRLSNHNLMIEKGRHFKPAIKREERLCPLCKIEVEDEEHFLLSCLLYSPQRKILERACRENCNTYDSLDKKQKLIFIMSNENQVILETLSTFIHHSLLLRDKIFEYFFI